VVAHSAAGKLQGLADDRIWYEVAYVAGVTHALNTVADGLRLPLEFSDSSRSPILALPPTPEDARPIFDEIMAFYATDHPPAVFRWMARDVGFLKAYWAATREAFADRQLDRRMKEALALAASLTAKSDWGVDFHLREARRLGLSDQALTETVEVVQLFNTVTKIADALQLQPDFDPRSTRAPTDRAGS
jgi:AhpD family alkylhydroperoxidase